MTSRTPSAGVRTWASRLARLRGANNEGLLAAIIVALVVAMSIVNPDFLSTATLFSLARNSLVPLVLAIGVLFVMVSGGIDVSFTAVAIFAAYAAITVGVDVAALSSPLVVLAIAVGIGALLGAGNGALIARFRLPTLIVTLGTQGIYRGVLLAFVGSSYIANLPAGLDALSGATLAQTTQSGAVTRLHLFVVPVALICVGAAWVLRRTMFGRCLHAMGGDLESARRSGMPVARYQLTVYIAVGALAAVAGVMHLVLSRNANPYELVGTELDVIAAVVLGGASITGGRGSVTGTVLGVALIGLITNSLVMLGVPGSWQRAAVGALLLAGLAAQALASRRRQPGGRPSGRWPSTRHGPSSRRGPSKRRGAGRGRPARQPVLEGAAR